MIRLPGLALVAMLLPVTALAGSLETEADAQVIAPAPAASLSGNPDLIFRLGAGLSYGSGYFGGTENELGPTGRLQLQFVRLPGGLTFGSPSGQARTGFSPHGSFRLIGERSATDYPELTGLNDVPLSVELGLGLGYASDRFSAFADARYGAVGHHAWVGEFGADIIMRPSDRLTLTAGPRLLVGSTRYANTYFGVTAAESVASGGALAAFNASGGAMTAGVEVGATYALSPLWSLDGALRYDRFVGDAGNSPIVAQGRDDDVRVSIGLSRLISLDF